MREMARVYGHFDLLRQKAEGGGLKKMTYSSLDNHNKSPYLQRTAPLLRSSPPGQPPLAQP